MRLVCHLVMASALICLAPRLLSQAPPSPDTAWQEVQDLTHRNAFTFIQRDGSCITGEIKAVKINDIVVKTSGSDKAALPKAGLSRILVGPIEPGPGDPQTAVLRTLYSGTSSWDDILQLGEVVHTAPTHKIFVVVTMQDGTVRKGDLRNATESEVTLNTSGNQIAIAKSEIRDVDFIQEKPLSSAGEYWWSEAVGLQIFDPELYPRIFHVGDTMPVRLYNSSIPEDNSRIACKVQSPK